MRGLTFEGPGAVRYHTDLPTPTLVDDHDVVVRVHLAGLCGSDLHPFEGRERVRAGTVPGHEVVGTIDRLGPGVEGFAVGDRVVVPFTTSCGVCTPCHDGLTARCERGALFGYADPDDLDAPALHGGQAELVRVPLAGTSLVHVPDDLDDVSAVLLADNLPTAWEAVERAAVMPGRPLTVVGLGAVGLCAVAAATALGAGPIVAVDPVPARRERARRLGARHTVAPDELPPASAARRDATAASVVEAAGSAAAQRLAFELLRPGGTLSIIAVQTTDRFAFTPVESYDRNVTVRTGRASVRATLDRLLPRIASGALGVPAGELLTDIEPLRHGPDTYGRFAEREGGLVKAAFDPRLP